MGDLETVTAICKEYRIANASFHLKQDCTPDEIVDVIIGTRVYIPAIYVMNKIDSITIEELDLIDRIPHNVPISAKQKWNLDGLVEEIWKKMKLTRIYTKPKGQMPDYTSPIILKDKLNCTLKDLCTRIHKNMVGDFK